jgi:hypothetical protein
MRKTVKSALILSAWVPAAWVPAAWIPAVLMLASATGFAKTDAVAANDQESIVLVFKDGHRKNLDMADVARIEFKTPVTLVFKDGRQQTVPAADIARIEFRASVGVTAADRARFVGKWELGQGDGSNFYATLEADGEARKSTGSSHGTWTVVDGEARISWDDGWHDAIRKVGSKYEKFAYEPGKSFDDTPSNVTAARNTQSKPI